LLQINQVIIEDTKVRHTNITTKKLQKLLKCQAKRFGFDRQSV